MVSNGLTDPSGQGLAKDAKGNRKKFKKYFLKSFHEENQTFSW